MKYAFLLVLIIFLGSCRNVETPEKPDDLISKDKMAAILAEVYMNNAARSVDLNLIRNSGIHLDSLVYQKFDIDSLQFANSNNYYSANLNMYIDILKDVEERLVVIQQSQDTTLRKSLKPIPKKDSIRAKGLAPAMDLQTEELP